MTQSAPRSAGLDTLRSLAILSVMMFHVYAFHGVGALPSTLEFAARMGWMGVDLFFVLSGYLIGSQLLRPYLRGERARLWTFYRNRAFRVLPAYCTVLALYLAIPVWRESPKPLARVLPFQEKTQRQSAESIFGCLRGLLSSTAGLDELVEPIIPLEDWDHLKEDWSPFPPE